MITQPYHIHNWNLNIQGGGISIITEASHAYLPYALSVNQVGLRIVRKRLYYYNFKCVTTLYATKQSPGHPVQRIVVADN